MNKGMTFDEVLQRMAAIHEAKNHDYGNSFKLSAQLLGRPVVEGLLHRMADKLSRCCNLVRSGQSMVLDEGLGDTLLDLSIYAILAFMSLEAPGGNGCKCGNGGCRGEKGK